VFTITSKPALRTAPEESCGLDSRIMASLSSTRLALHTVVHLVEIRYTPPRRQGGLRAPRIRLMEASAAESISAASGVREVWYLT
jgi:hypothetical protein